MLKQALFVTLIALGTTNAWGLTSDEITFAQMNRPGSLYYEGAVTGTVWAFQNMGLMQCPSIVTGGVVQQTLASMLLYAPELAKTPFTHAVGIAMLRLGCTWTSETKAEAKSYY